jgi:ADP-ribose pyrophosphatase
MDEMMREEKVAGSTVYDGKIVRLDVDRVRLPNGREVVREVVRHPGAVVVVPVLDHERIVLVRQYRYPVEDELLELPAGKLDPGEEPLACARRELAEETGYRGQRWKALGSFYTTPGFTNEVLHAFVAEGLEEGSEASPDPDEILRAVSLPVGEIFKMAREGRLRDAKTLAALFLWQLWIRGH